MEVNLKKKKNQKINVHSSFSLLLKFINPLKSLSRVVLEKKKINNINFFLYILEKIKIDFLK